MVDMTLLTDLEDELDKSGLKAKYERLIAPLSDPQAKKSAKHFAEAVRTQLPAGRKPDAVYACKTCRNQLPRRILIKTQKATTLKLKNNSTNRLDAASIRGLLDMDAIETRGVTALECDTDEDEEEPSLPQTGTVY